MAATPAEASDLPRMLGERVRGLRKARGLTLKQLGQSVGLSHAFLSQFERGLSVASVATLQRIAAGLGTTVSALLASPAGQEVDVLHADEGLSLHAIDAAAGGVARSLTRVGWPVQPIEYTGGPEEFGEYFEHVGHEMLYVITGQVELDFADGRRERLGPRDTATYPGSKPHRWRVLGTELSRLLLIVAAQTTPT